MRTTIATFAAILMAGLFAQYATAESIPDWIRNNALWWSEGSISQTDFISGIQFLIQEDILQVPTTQVSETKSNEVPEWVKNNAAWWAQGQISDTDFISGVQFLIKSGVITVESSSKAVETSEKPTMANSSFEAELEACQEITRAYDRLKCEDEVEAKIMIQDYKENSEIYVAGPITFYYKGADLEFMSSGQPNLSIKVLAENTGSNDNVALMCTGPSVCNYDVWNGEKAYKYSSTDFTSGQTVIKPGQFDEIDMLFGPNIGYGGTTFEYDSNKDYYFRVSEPWGSVEIPLNLE